MIILSVKKQQLQKNMPVITTRIIHIETDCTPAKSNAVWSIWIRVLIHNIMIKYYSF